MSRWLNLLIAVLMFVLGLLIFLSSVLPDSEEEEPDYVFRIEKLNRPMGRKGVKNGNS